MSEKMFEVAVRSKMRFPFKGVVSVEDLWDLSVKDLDSVFKTLNSQVKQAKEESLLDTKSKEDEVLDFQIEIVKYIVKVKHVRNLLDFLQKQIRNRSRRSWKS